MELVLVREMVVKVKGLNPLKTEFILNTIHSSISYLTGNMLQHHEDQQTNAV
jgi:hypothetical protein